VAVENARAASDIDVDDVEEAEAKTRYRKSAPAAGHPARQPQRATRSRVRDVGQAPIYRAAGGLSSLCVSQTMIDEIREDARQADAEAARRASTASRASTARSSWRSADSGTGGTGSLRNSFTSLVGLVQPSDGASPAIDATAGVATSAQSSSASSSFKHRSRSPTQLCANRFLPQLMRQRAGGASASERQ